MLRTAKTRSADPVIRQKGPWIVGAIRKSAEEGKPWRVIVTGIVISAVVIGMGLGVLARDWAFGFMAGGIILAIPIGCVLLNLALGAICIPPMVLVMKLFGDRSQRQPVADDSQDNGAQRAQSSGRS